MALSRPEKPLKILTLDGGGLQAISTLLILDRLLQTIQEANGADFEPRPCDVFDVISGIGAGGWLAILLGRFRLDIQTALTEWYNLTDCIVPRSRSEGIRRRFLRNSYWDEEQLVQRVNYLTTLYGVGDTLIDPHPFDSRCRYVFVAAHQARRVHEANEYNLFRTYEVPQIRGLRRGPDDPTSFKISHAFGVTGAARYFSRPWKEHVAADGRKSFLDNAFPHPHNITLLALQEMWTLFGPDVPISVIVNIGPGFPADADLQHIVRRFSFGLRPGSPRFLKARHRQKSLDRNKVPALTTPKPSKTPDLPKTPDPSKTPDPPNSTIQDLGQSLADIAYNARNQRLLKEEIDLEEKIREQLRAHSTQSLLYHRLALKISQPGATRNDARNPSPTLKATSNYCDSPEAVRSMEEISHVVDVVA